MATLFGLTSFLLSACSDRPSEDVSGTNRLEIIAADNFTSRVHEMRYFVRGADGVAVPWKDFATSRGLSASLAGDAGVLTAAPATKLAKIRLAVLLANFRDDRSQPWTPAEVRGEAFDNEDSTAAYYREASYGNVSVTGDVFGWYTLPMDKPSGCDNLNRILDELLSFVPSEALAAYTNVAVAFPRICESWDGFGTVGGIALPARALEEKPSTAVVWINGSEAFRSVLIHELGHNLGVHHANGCQGLPTGAVCRSLEYEDPFDVMGYVHLYEKPRHMNAYHKEAMGWLEARNVAIATGGGTYAILPLESAQDGVQLLKIPRDANAWYYLEYRQPIGFDAEFGSESSVVKGTSIRLAPAYLAGGDSHLIDTTPGSYDFLNFGDAPLQVGQTYYDPAAKIQIRTVSATAEKLTVEVEMTPSEPIPALNPPPAPSPEILCSILTGECNL